MENSLDSIFSGEEQTNFLPSRGGPPPWRRCSIAQGRGGNHIVSDEERAAIKAAFYLRRPLLVTGDPGVGKSSLAYAIAQELRLGKVLVWPITSRSILQHGLYSYDSVGRLNQVALNQKPAHDPDFSDEQIGDYLSLGPLGSAICTSTEDKPRVLLIDELDKSDVDLPNDLLHVLEEGEFVIPELARLKTQTVSIPVLGGGRIPVSNGEVKSSASPFILMTSNGEREFPPAFLRRCLRLEVKRPGKAQLKRIVLSKLGDAAPRDKELDAMLDVFEDQSQQRKLATDQLLNAAFLVAHDRIGTDPAELGRIFQALE